MTGAEALLRLEDLGARFRLAPNGSIRAELPDPEPAALPLFLAELLAHRDDAVRLLQAREPACPAAGEPSSCYQCDAPLRVETDLLCTQCFAARRGPGRVLPFDAEPRRRRTLARLANQHCWDCGGSNWQVNDRGDAVCRRCHPTRG